MANPTPSAVFGPDYAATSTTLTFKFASNTDPVHDMAAISSALAHPTTGDARTVIYGILERLAAWYGTILPADRPDYMKIAKSGSLTTDVTGATVASVNFTLNFKAQPGSLPLIAE